MISQILVGLFAAVLTLIPQFLHQRLSPEWALRFQSPVLILGFTVIAVLFQRFFLDHSEGSPNYDGVADLMIHIHSPSTPDSPARWMVRGVISLLMSVWGGVAGQEGSAIELGHAFGMSVRARSARWFEQRRRTDASLAIAAGVSAAFRAPFAAVILPIELGMGGRTIASVVSSLIAFLTSTFLVRSFHLEIFDVSATMEGFHFSGWQSWVAPVVLGVLIGVLGAGLVRFLRFGQDSLLDLFQTQAWMRILAAGIVIFLVVVIYPGANISSLSALEEVFWSHGTLSGLGILFFSKVLILSMLVAGFGTLGIFWPIFALGGMLGFGFNSFLWSGMPGFSVVMGLAGAAAAWGAILGAPISASILAFELTQNSQAVIPCLICGLIAQGVRRVLMTPPIHEKDLEARGIHLIDGRSAVVLEHLSVREAMVTDHELVHEHEPVSELYTRLTRSPYAFLPVVNSQGVYMGLLTADLIQEAWSRQSEHGGESPLSRLVGAKDLLYRSGLKVLPVKASDRLSATGGLFQEVPCVPVVTEDQRVLGLLFSHAVRLAYEREVAHRSLSFESREI